MRTAAARSTVATIVHDTATSTTARAGARRDEPATLRAEMSSVVLSSSSSVEVAVRVAWALACAVLAVVVVSRSKPATSRRPVLVRVDHKPVPLHREPGPQERWKSAGRLGTAAVVGGVLLAIVAGFLAAFLLAAAGELLS